MKAKKVKVDLLVAFLDLCEYKSLRDKHSRSRHQERVQPRPSVGEVVPEGQRHGTRLRAGSASANERKSERERPLVIFDYHSFIHLKS